MKKTARLFLTYHHLIPDYFPESTISQASIQLFQPNQQIQQAGEPLCFLFYLLDGKAKILKTQRNGKQSIIQFLTSGDFIGELTLIRAEKETKAVVAISEVACLAIPINQAQELINSVHFLQEISHYVGSKLLNRVEHFTINQTYPLVYRLAEVLLTASVEGVYREKQTEVAEYLGVSYRHLMYTMKQLREQGYIRKTTQGYVINQERLESYQQQLEQ